MSQFKIISASSVAGLVCLVLIICGCSVTMSENTVSPGFIPDTSATNMPIMSRGQAIHSLWGFYWVYVDPGNNSWEITPGRVSEIHMNIRGFLEDGKPCADCFKITGISPGPGYAEVNIRISHPWSDLQTFTGFDVRGIAMWNGSEHWPAHDLLTQDPYGNDGYIYNADGYTTLYNPTTYPAGSDIPLFTYTKGKFATIALPDSTLNPYIDYFTDENRHIFAAGGSMMKSWHVRMPQSGPFVLGYAIDASWGQPSVSPPVMIPDDFPVGANRAEPWKTELIQSEPLENTTGSSLTLQVKVWDWQGNPAGVKMECPEIWSGVKEDISSISNLLYTIFDVPVQNETGAGDGTYRALVSVEDALNPGSSMDLTMYGFFDIVVGESGNHAPVSAAQAGQVTAWIGEPIFFQTMATDPDGPGDIAQWWWDWENDGTWDYAASSTSKAFYETGVYEIDHRVVDQGGLDDDLEPDELLQVEIFDPCCNNFPIAAAQASQTSVVVGEILTLTSLSTDPDGAFCIESLGWDYSGDGVMDEYGDEIQISFNTPGIYEIQHEVIDSCELSDLLDDPIIIEVSLDCCQEPPVAIISDIPSDIVADEIITISHYSYDPESPACEVTVAWDLDDDGDFDDSTENEVDISWEEAGIKTIHLQAMDECGLTDVDTIEVTVHIGVLMPEDIIYKTEGLKYSYISADLYGSTASEYVDPLDVDGPWDFTSLELMFEGHYRATLSKDHAEVQPFKDYFPASYDHFYKAQGIFNLFPNPLYFAEKFTSFPDRMVWVGFYEQTYVGAFNFSPSLQQPYPFWVYSDFYAHVSSPFFADLEYTYVGIGEGTVSVPWNSTTEYCVLVKSVWLFDTLSLWGDILLYQWILDDGTVVAEVSAINTDFTQNYDPDTGEINGIATYNALSAVGAY